VVLAGLGTFGPPPDIVLSGINRGANAGYATLHSGTVGAALTAANQGSCAMAVSLDVLSALGADPATGGATLAQRLDALDDEGLEWATAAHLAGTLLGQLSGLPDGTILNLNVPNRPLATLPGVRMASLAPFGQVQMAIAESGEGFVRTAIQDNSDRSLEGTDLALLAQGYATVTPIRSIRAVEDVKLDLPPDRDEPSLFGELSNPSRTVE
jgi:5'-nucleotidase